jgi:hypothetical protein
VFHDVLNAINVLGFLIVFLGVMLYKLQFHFRKMQEKEDPVEEEEVAALDNVPLEDGSFHDNLFSIGDNEDDDALIDSKKTSEGNGQARTETSPHKQTKNGYTSIEIDNHVNEIS